MPRRVTGGLGTERDAGALAEALGRDWYHTIELAPGQATPGYVDLRPNAAKVLPADLAGKRALDVGTFDGFWAFELERRNAEHVYAADLDSHDETDWPPPNRARLAREMRESNAVPGERFRLAHGILGSRVERIACSIYDLEPERVGGGVDYALIGALLLHLRDPVKGLERVHSVLFPGGRLLIVEPFSPFLSLIPRRVALARLRALETNYTWWLPNIVGLHHMLRLGGFGELERKAIFRPRTRDGRGPWHVAIEARRLEGFGA